jgi:hypothetical protein
VRFRLGATAPWRHGGKTGPVNEACKQTCHRARGSGL